MLCVQVEILSYGLGFTLTQYGEVITEKRAKNSIIVPVGQFLSSETSNIDPPF